MPAAHLTPARLSHFESLLREQRQELTNRLAGLAATMSEIRDARGDTSVDDEHDPEGPTMTTEWMRITALQADDTSELADVDAALDRIGAGTYGTCRRCGKPITIARLDARPATELCIDCARLVDAAR